MQILNCTEQRTKATQLPYQHIVLVLSETISIMQNPLVEWIWIDTPLFIATKKMHVPSETRGYAKHLIAEFNKHNAENLETLLDSTRLALKFAKEQIDLLARGKEKEAIERFVALEDISFPLEQIFSI